MVRRLAKGLCACFAISFLATPAMAEKPAVIALSPAPEWRVASSTKAAIETITQYGGDLAIEHEYGVKSVEVRICQLGGKTVKVLVEHSPDASNAYGLLTFYRNEKTTPLADLPLAAIGSGGALLARGRFFFRIPRTSEGGSEVSDNDLLSLVLTLVNTRPPGQERATLPDNMPQQGIVPGSEKYLLGEEAARRVLPNFRTDLIGFSQEAEVQLADYSVGKSRATVMAIAYPTPQMARGRFGEMEKVLQINQDHGPGSIYGKRLGSYIILALDSGSAANAKSLTDMFKTTGQVTQNERYPGKPIIIQMGELIFANLIFVMILSGIAIGGGVIFYLSHEFAKRWLPRTQWGAQDEATIITLKLT